MPQDSPPEQDEQILVAVRALQSGSGRDAFEVIFRRYYQSLYAFFANQPSLRDEADDLTQVTLTRAYEKIHQYRFEAAFWTWLRHIAENVWKNARREREALKRPQLVEARKLAAVADGETSAPALFGEDLHDEEPNPEEAFLAEERTQILHEAVEALPPGMRLCAELRLFSDLRYREIAEAMGISINSVRSQLFEARKRLKPVLDEYFQGAEF